MKNAGRWAALLGLLLAVGLVAHDGIEPVLRLLTTAGWGLLLAASFHIVPMTINARSWQILMVPTARPGLGVVTTAVWVRESVNGLLPVARIGGEVAGYRVLTRHGVPPVPAAAGLLVDMAVTLLSQGVFCLAGGALLVAYSTEPRLMVQLTLGFAVLVAFGAVFVVMQRSGMFGKLVRAASRLGVDRWAGLASQGARIDRATQAIYRRRGRIVACFGWQLVGWSAGAVELWLALFFLGHPVSFAEALIVEATVQAIASIAFLVPGALGVQEGGFLLIGAALGIDGPTALALAASRRLRDLLIFFPGLVAWHRAESKPPAAGPMPNSRVLP